MFVWDVRSIPSGIETDFHLQSNSLTSRGLNPGAPSVYGPLAQIFVASITVPKLERRDWQKVSAFFSKVAGQSGLIRMADPKRIRPGVDMRQLAASEPWGDGTFFDDGTGWGESITPPFASVYEPEEFGADSFVISGLPASVDPCLWAGDLVEIRPNGIPTEHGHLYEIANDAPTDASGRTRVNISPILRKGIAAGDMVVLHEPMTVFRLVDDNQGALSHLGGGLASVGFSLMEQIPE